MVTVEFGQSFKKLFSKIKDPVTKERIIKHIAKLKDDPELGKPMRFARKGTRELYISPFRLSYMYLNDEDRLLMIDLYHKDEQ